MGARYNLAIIVLGAFAEGFVTNNLLYRVTLRLRLITSWAHRCCAPQRRRRLIVALCAVPLLWIEYLLLRPVSKHLVLLAVLFNLVSFPKLIGVLMQVAGLSYLTACFAALFAPHSRFDNSRHSGSTIGWRIVILSVAACERCKYHEVERASEHGTWDLSIDLGTRMPQVADCRSLLRLNVRNDPYS